MSVTTARPNGAHSRENVLIARGLNIGVRTKALVQNISFTINAGERVGLIGESGSGKSLTALGIMGLLPEDLGTTGSVRLAGADHDLVGASERQMSQVRGRDIAMVFQDPMTALIHRTRPNRKAARASVVELLGQVGIPDPAEAVRAYPHQLSGGQRQRVVLAIALANDPVLLICDEPTTALDVTVQALVLDLIVRGVQRRDAAMLFITHDLAVVAAACERVLVMYGGRIVESGPVQEVFTRPRHRYTQGLLGAADLAVVDSRGRLATIAGSVPPAGTFPAGCVFRNRCPHATELCAVRPEWTSISSDSGYACHHPAPISGEVRDG